METLDVDVAIVGAGPSGMAAAALLGRVWRVALIERHPAPYGLPRAGHIDHEIVRILQGVQAHQPLLEDGVTDSAYRWFGADGELLFSFHGKGSVSGFPSDVMMYQPVLEDALRARIDTYKSRVQTLMGWEATELEQSDEGVSVLIQSRGGDRASMRRRITARYLLGADGARSTVRSLLGVNQTDIGFAEEWLDVDVRLRRPLDRDIDGQFCDPARPTYIGALGKRYHRFEFAKLPNETRADLESPAKAWELLSAHGVTSDDVEIVRQVVYRFEAKVADTWRVGSCFLLGDAAHTMPPHFGQGLCSGIRDAATLSWKLDLALRGSVNETFLDTYEQERHPHAEQWVQNSVQVGRISCTLDAVVAEIRDETIRRGDAPPLPAPALGDGVFQRSGAVDAAAGLARQIAPQGTVGLDGRAGLLHDLIPGGFVLLHRRRPYELAPDVAGRTAAERFRVSIYPVVADVDEAASGRILDTEGTYTRFFDEHGVDAVLIRPDYYIFGATVRGEDPLQLLVELDSVTDVLSGSGRSSSANLEIRS